MEIIIPVHQPVAIYGLQIGFITSYVSEKFSVKSVGEE